MAHRLVGRVGQQILLRHIGDISQAIEIIGPRSTSVWDVGMTLE
jgi:hypothetical protein